jgi:hypothetical protein
MDGRCREQVFEENLFGASLREQATRSKMQEAFCNQKSLVVKGK